MLVPAAGLATSRYVVLALSVTFGIVTAKFCPPALDRAADANVTEDRTLSLAS